MRKYIIVMFLACASTVTVAAPVNKNDASSSNSDSRSISSMIDLLPVFVFVRQGQYIEATAELQKLIEKNKEDEKLQKIREKLVKVMVIASDVTGKDRISTVIRKGLMSYLKPKEDPQDALSKIRYAWEKSKDKKVTGQLYSMLKLNYPDIAKSEQISDDVPFVDYKLFQALNHIYDGRYDMAIKECNQILDLEPDNVVALKRLGSALYCLGKAEKKPAFIEEGRNVWKKVIKINPADEEIREFLKND